MTMNPGSLRTISAALALTLSTVALIPPAVASPCDAIRDADRRNACLGRTRSSTDCESVRDADRRAACRAEARR